MKCAFVSCDVIGHSSERSLEVQRQRIAGINEIVRQVMVRRDPADIVWASGGDGGHVALFASDFAHDAIDLILEWRRWAARDNVSLRIAANLGDVEKIQGADGRAQLVGHGINLAGRLLAFSDQNRVIVTVPFRNAVQSSGIGHVHFHEERVVEPRFFPAQSICLMSSSGAFESRWDLAPFRSDEQALQQAITLNNGLDAIYFARRLLQVDANHEYAKATLRTIASAGTGLLPGDNLISELLRDREYGEQYIHGMQLIERNKGDVLCRSGDEGQTMFLILRGQLAGFLPTVTGSALDLNAKPAFVMRPGELVGELAFSLQRKRTATLYCIEETALLCFSYSDCLRSLDGMNRRVELQEFVDRKIRARLLEHVCNAAAYLIGKTSDGKSTGPLAKKASPWIDLLPFFRLIELTFESTPEFETNDEAFSPAAIYVLLGGKVERIGSSEAILDGQDERLIHVNLAPQIHLKHARYRLIENVTIGAISASGLMKFGVATYRDIVRTLEKCLAEDGISVSHSGGPEAGSQTKRFDVAISYPGEHRKLVEAIADALAVKLSKSRVFFDHFYEAELARPNLDTYLQKVYHKDSKLVLVILCREYDEKQWCGLESRAIRDLIKRRRDDEIMFVRVGEGDVEGVFGIDGYIDSREKQAGEIADIVCARLALLQSANSR